MKDKNLTNEEIVKIYTKCLFSPQKEAFNNTKKPCPYYKITLKTLKKLHPEDEKHLNRIKNLSLSKTQLAWKLWNEILSPDKYKEKEEGQKRFNKVQFTCSKINKNILLSGRSFWSLYRSKGIDLPYHQFKWLAKKDLIAPLPKNEKYSPFQIWILDQIRRMKKKSLDYPKFVSHPSPKIGGLKKGISWQEYLLLNKKLLKDKNKEWNEVVQVLHPIKKLYESMLETAAKEASAINQDKKSKYLIRDIFNYMTREQGKELAQKINKKNPEMTFSKIRAWRNNRLPAWVIMHNPVFQIAKEVPALPRIFSRHEGRVSTIFTKGKPEKVANYYIKIINYLGFYLECFGKKVESIEEITANPQSKKGERFCEFCGEKFIPNPKRRGGRPQRICGKEECKKELKKRLGRQRYIREKQKE